MTVNKPRTIDNMGIETSSRYARDQAALDSNLVKESQFIPQKTEVSVVKPYISTSFDQYIGPDHLALWASFAPPPDFLGSGKPLFSYQLIPSLGGYEQQEANSDKLEALEDALNKGFKEGGKQKGEDQQFAEKERKTLLHLLQTIKNLDRTLTMINARRNQYQKG